MRVNIDAHELGDAAHSAKFSKGTRKLLWDAGQSDWSTVEEYDIRSISIQIGSAGGHNILGAQSE